MTLLLDYPATETARAVRDAMMDGLVRDYGTPTTMRNEGGCVVLEWHRPGEVFRVNIDEFGGLTRQLMERLPGELASLPMPPADVCQPSEEEQGEYDRKNVQDLYDGGRL